MATSARTTAGGLGVIGILIPSVGVVIEPIWRFPTTASTGARIAEFATGHRAALMAMMVCYTAGVTLWLAFGATVWKLMQSGAARDSVLPPVFASGLVAFVTLLLGGFTAFDVLVYRGSPPAQASVLYDVTFGLLAMSGMPTAVALTAYALSVYRFAWLPRHTAHLAATAAVAHVVLPVSLVARHGFWSLEGPLITLVPALLWAWILVTGIALLSTGRAAPAGAAR